jgi:DNA-binding transcriptional MerR regulator
MARYTIKDIERFTGIKTHTIRIWEKRYHVVEPSRTETNIRFYTDDELRRILNISILNKRGFRISKIASLSSSELAEKVLEVCSDSGDFENQIESLVLAMVELNEDKFEKNFSNLLLRLGFEDTITKVVFPFFERIGILWQTGSILPVHEHFVSHLIRQKLMVAVDALFIPVNGGHKTFTLFLPEAEAHEMGMLFYNYLIRKSGHSVIYLGQSLPFSDLIELYRFKPTDYYLTSFISAVPDGEILDYVQRLSKALPDKTILMSGLQSTSLNLKGFSNVHLVADVTALNRFLAEIP